MTDRFSTRIGRLHLSRAAALLAVGLAALTFSSAWATPAGGAWTPTGPMAQGRQNHTAILLLSGKVLVAGGNFGSSALASAELYDPAARTWSATGSMSAARAGYTATLLNDGKVLAAGGFGGAGPLASAELYDPTAGTWAATAAMSAARFDFTVTRLPDNLVLVVGGHDALFGSQASTELYDPAAGLWSDTGSMGAVRGNHAATLLLDGTVLVAGGDTGATGGPLASAEIYDPTAGTWSDTGSMAAARTSHTGIRWDIVSNDFVVAAGGFGGDRRPLASTEIYDPAAGTWSATGSMTTARAAHTAILLLPQPIVTVLVAGGDGGAGSLASAELYQVDFPPAGRR